MSNGNGKGYFDFQHPMSKTQPAKLSDREREGQGNAKQNGTPNKFETGAFGTNTEGSDYHDIGRKDSGLHGNFAQKDDHIEMLKDRGQGGQSVSHWSGNNKQAEFQTNQHAGTVYNGSPIPEVYQPASSHGVAPRYPVEIEEQNCVDYEDTKQVDSEGDSLKKKVK